MLNVICLMGRLVADPELHATNSGANVTSFRIAVDRSYSKEKKTDFINIAAWRNTAENICKFFHKGDLIVVKGELQTRDYEDKSGNKRTIYEVVADGFEFVGGKSSTSQQNAAPAGAQPFATGDYSVVDDTTDLPF